MTRAKLTLTRAQALADAKQLATLWFRLAEACDLPALARALEVGKRRLQAARTALCASPDRYDTFVRSLVGGLDDARPRIRFACAHALDSFGDATHRAALARLMDDPVPRVRWIAMHALTCHACGDKPDVLEPRVRERIVRAVAADPSPRVRRNAAAALAIADGPRPAKAVAAGV